jgi:PadR family transcriptional regulator, regulatory protein PadR
LQDTFVTDELPPSIERWETQLRKGCLELVILACLWSGERYGLEIVRQLATSSNLVMPEGTIYPLMSRLRAEGCVQARWVAAETGHPRKYYRLTQHGRDRTLALARSWSSFATSVEALLAPVREEVP